MVNGRKEIKFIALGRHNFGNLIKGRGTKKVKNR